MAKGYRPRSKTVLRLSRGSGDEINVNERQFRRMLDNPHINGGVSGGDIIRALTVFHKIPEDMIMGRDYYRNGIPQKDGTFAYVGFRAAPAIKSTDSNSVNFESVYSKTGPKARSVFRKDDLTGDLVLSSGHGSTLHQSASYVYDNMVKRLIDIKKNKK